MAALTNLIVGNKMSQSRHKWREHDTHCIRIVRAQWCVKHKPEGFHFRVFFMVISMIRTATARRTDSFMETLIHSNAKRLPACKPLETRCIHL